MIFFQPLVDCLQNLAYNLAAIAARNFQRLGQYCVAVRVQVLEAQFFKFLIDGIEPQAVGDGRVDFHGFACDALALFARHGFQCAHIVQPVRQFDQDDPHVARHRQQHLAEILRLRIFAGFKFDLFQLAQAIDQLSHRLAKFFGYFLIADMGVFHHVVQQCSHDGLCIEV